MRCFKKLWDAIKDRRKGDDPDAPRISAALPIIRWKEVFRDYLHRFIGVRCIPLAYVICENVTVLVLCPALANNQSYSTEHMLVEGDLIIQSSHVHGLVRDNNAGAYYKLEEATYVTSYADSIKPFQRRKDGCSSFLALIAQYTGVDKWETEIKKQYHLLHTHK